MGGFRDKMSESLVLAIPEYEASKMKKGIRICRAFPDVAFEWVPPSEVMNSPDRREVRLSLEIIHRGRKLVVTEPYGELRPSVRIWKTERNLPIDRLLCDAVVASLHGPLGLGSVPVEEISMEGIRTFGAGVEIEVMFRVELDPESKVAEVSGQHWQRRNVHRSIQESQGSTESVLVH